MDAVVFNVLLIRFIAVIIEEQKTTFYDVEILSSVHILFGSWCISRLCTSNRPVTLANLLDLNMSMCLLSPNRMAGRCDSTKSLTVATTTSSRLTRTLPPPSTRSARCRPTAAWRRSDSRRPRLSTPSRRMASRWWTANRTFAPNWARRTRRQLENSS